jgi:hypothetical protein
VEEEEEERREKRFWNILVLALLLLSLFYVIIKVQSPCPSILVTSPLRAMLPELAHVSPKHNARGIQLRISFTKKTFARTRERHIVLLLPLLGVRMWRRRRLGGVFTTQIANQEVQKH